MELSDVKEIIGRVITVNYPKSETEAEQATRAWRAMFIDTDEHGSLSASGFIGWKPRPKEILHFYGAFELYRGRPSFKFTRVEHDIPANERGYLHQACEMTRGIGAATEEAIWDAMGDDWRNVTSRDVKISESVLAWFHESINYLAQNAERAKTVAFLLGCGCTDNMATVAFERWGAETISRVQADPYILVQLRHYSFREIDQRVAVKFHIEKNDNRRISAAVKHALRTLTESSTVASWYVVYDEVRKYIPDAAPERISDTVAAMCKVKWLHVFQTAVQENPNLAPDNLFRAEYSISNYITSSLGFYLNFDNVEINETKLDFVLDDAQRAAVQSSINYKITIINGGAGCGKTSIIQCIADTLGDNEVIICTFAGKAAARLREKTKHHASTIHSMLGYKGETLGFTVKSLEDRTVIIDEASMVNSELLAEITNRNPRRLILVGDEAQLPPVGPGSPFHDLVRLIPEVVQTLTTCYRNSEAVYKAALAVRGGEVPALEERTANEYWKFVNTGDDSQTHAAILALVRDGEINFSTDLVLCCRNGENTVMRSAVESLNIDIKSIVNPAAPDDERLPLRQLDVGDRVICTVNDPNTDTWNGTTGTIRTIDISGGAYIGLDFPTAKDETEVYIEKSKIKNWSLAYALTIHKSQGSQYRRIFCVCLNRDTRILLDRSMLYTAMTRATAACFCLGQPQAFRAAIARVDKRATCIQEFLKK